MPINDWNIHGDRESFENYAKDKMSHGKETEKTEEELNQYEQFVQNNTKKVNGSMILSVTVGLIAGLTIILLAVLRDFL